MKLNYITVFTALILLQACTLLNEESYTLGEAPVPKTQGEAVKLTENAPRFQGTRVKPLDKGTLFSNENVIMYPLDRPAAAVTRTFPEYRGVIDNTTAGGYTVFDSSVTVYALESGETKPSYLPDYSVPQYAEQYQTDRLLAEKREITKAAQQQVLAARPKPRALTNPEPVNNLTSPTLPQQTPRRSRSLTAYE